MEYVIPVIIIFYGIINYDYLKKTRGRLMLWVLLCIYLILLSGLRYRLGSDTIMYINDYNTFPSLNDLDLKHFEKSRYNPGFIVLFSFFKMLSPDFLFFQLFQAFFINTIYFYFFYKNTKNIFFAALLYYIFLYVFTSFLQLRDSFAIGIFLLAWPFFQQRKWILWYLFSALAFSFHLSAIIMFILPVINLPFIKNLFEYGKQTWLIIFGIVIIGFIIQQTFFNYLELISISEKMTERAQAYEDNELGGSILNFTGIISTLIKYVFYPLLVLFILKKKPKGQNTIYDFNTLQAFVLINTYIIIFSIFIDIANRLTNYFFPFVILLLSDFIFSTFTIGSKRFRLQFLTWIIFFLPMLCLGTYSLTYSKINKSGTLRTYMMYYPYSSYIYQQQDLDQKKAYSYTMKHF